MSKQAKNQQKLDAQKARTYSVLNINRAWLHRAGQLVVRHQVNHQLSPEGLAATDAMAALLQQLLAHYQVYFRAVHETQFNTSKPELYLLPEVAARLTGGQRESFAQSLKSESQAVLGGIQNNLEILSSHFQEMTTAGPFAAGKILEALLLLQGQMPASMQEGGEQPQE